MTKTILSALISLAALAYSPAYARTDLAEDWTDHPTMQRYHQRPQYAARTECELHQPLPSPPSIKPVSASPKKSSLLERLSAALEKDCGRVRAENNQIICEDYVKCTKKDMTEQEYQTMIDGDLCGGNEYCPGPSPPSCIEWQMKERWRFDPNTIGKVDALLIDAKKLLSGASAGYALRPAGKNELYVLQEEHTAREMKNLLNQGK